MENTATAPGWHGQGLACSEGLITHCTARSKCNSSKNSTAFRALLKKPHGWMGTSLAFRSRGDAPGDAGLGQTPAERFGIFSPLPRCPAGLVSAHQPSAYRSRLPRKLFMDRNQVASCLSLKRLSLEGRFPGPEVMV